jgi:hypothetical protein
VSGYITRAAERVGSAIEAHAAQSVEAARIEAQGRVDAAKVPRRTIALPPTTQERHR